MSDLSNLHDLARYMNERLRASSPTEQYRRYRQTKANPASTPESQLARRQQWYREWNARHGAAVAAQLAFQVRQAPRVR